MQIEGTSYSGRLRFLHLCNSDAVAYKQEYAEVASHLLYVNGAEQNLVEVNRD